MDTKDLKGLMEAYSKMYAPQQIDEISQKTATRAYAASKTGEFEGADSDRDLKRTDNLEKHIKRKFGDKAVKHAEKAAEVQTFGRKDASGRRKQSPQPRIQTSDHENQREFKRELKIRRDRRLRAARGEDTNEQVDIFDVVLEFLQAEGIAQSLEEAQWMMANLIDEEAIAIILGESALGTMAVLGGMAAGRAIHGKLQGRKEKKEREAKRRTSDYLGMKSRTKNVVARDRRASGDTRNEEFELWVNSLVEEGYDLSDYTWDEMYEFYLDEALTGERYKKVMKKPGGTAYSRKVSADPAKRATRGGKGGESDFGAGDRGSGNKAARRAGTYKEYDVNEAQHARENPEKYEREQEKKSAPVRGEKTPMPPRGDKRREEFEKWYAKQMGR